MAWDSVIREFEIIGEASKYLLRDKLLESQYQEVVDFRNQITHAYFGIESTLKQELIDSCIEDNKYLDFVVSALEKLR